MTQTPESQHIFNMVKAKKAPSAHSRAARRATSPSINTDRSLKEARAPAESVDQRPAILAAHHNSGVSKKSKRKTVMSRAARQRHERAADMAEAVAERTAVKVQKSKASARVIESRKKTWDEINKDPVIKSKGASLHLRRRATRVTRTWTRMRMSKMRQSRLCQHRWSKPSTSRMRYCWKTRRRSYKAACVQCRCIVRREWFGNFYDHVRRSHYSSAAAGL